MSYLAHAVRRSPRRARLTAGIILLMLAAFALVWIGRASAVQGGPSGPADVSKSVSTVIPKADAVDSIANSCTSSASFIDMSDMLVSFRLAGNAPRAVIVLFQGVWEGFNPGVFAHIRLTIDNVVQSGPADLRVDHRGASASDESETHGFNFVSDPVAPGLHLARIQWRTSSQGCVDDRSLIVLHK